MAKNLPTADQFADKWKKNTAASVPDYKIGIQGVTVSPTELAAAKEDKMLANLTAAIQSGKWANSLRAISLDEWKRLTLEKGGVRFGPGVNAATDKMRKFATVLLPHIQTGRDKIKTMPDLTPDDMDNRMLAFSRHMRELSYIE